jgi:hypothetical protein
MRFRTLFLLIFVCSASVARAADTWTSPYPGVQHLYRTTATPNHIHAIKVDLTRATIRLHATKTADRAKTVSAFAGQYNCQVATNGDFFSYQGYPTIGLAVGGEERWPNSTDGADEGFVAIGRDNHTEISVPSQVVDPPASWMSEIVSGHPLLVDNGVATADVNCTTSFCNRNPRTAVGLTQDAGTLLLVVVDGRSTASVGMSFQELAALMIDLGAWRALNLDGGGSSAMFIAGEGGVQNTPSDGMERVVANHLGIAIVQPFGTLKGYVREGAVGNTTGGVAGAQVTLSTGASTTTDANGLYTVANVPRGDVNITVNAAGFDTATRMVFVAAGDTTWGSIALQRATAMPDAAVPDAASVDAAAGGGGTGGASGAGGAPSGGASDMASGCAIGGAARTPTVILLTLLLVGATRRLRRR